MILAFNAAAGRSTGRGGPGNVIHGGTTILAAIRKTVTPGTKVTFSADGSDVKGRMPSSSWWVKCPTLK